MKTNLANAVFNCKLNVIVITNLKKKSTKLVYKWMHCINT